MNRMSSFPAAVRCGLAPRLGAQHGAGEAAFQSTAYHARLAQAPGWEAAWARLTQDERDEVEGWGAPTPLHIGDHVLEYERALVEVQVVMGSGWTPLEVNGQRGWGVVEDGPRVDGRIHVYNRGTGEVLEIDDPGVSVGHIDMAWMEPIVVDGVSVAVIGDSKRTAFTSPIDSLQLHAYGWSWAEHIGAEAYTYALWILSEARWIASPEIVHLGSFDAAGIHERLTLAQSNNGPATTGAHCSECWSRMHCPEHLIPAAVAEANGKLGVFATPDALHHGNALEALMLAKSYQDLADKLTDHVKAYARQAGGIRGDDGRVWRELKGAKPGEVFDLAALKKGEPDIVRKYTSMVDAKPYNQGFRWSKC